jgi:hypothetical protein
MPSRFCWGERSDSGVTGTMELWMIYTGLMIRVRKTDMEVRIFKHSYNYELSRTGHISASFSWELGSSAPANSIIQKTMQINPRNGQLYLWSVLP